jgi:hypothetical protein
MWLLKSQTTYERPLKRPQKKLWHPATSRKTAGLIAPSAVNGAFKNQRPLKRPKEISATLATSRKTAGLLALRASTVNGAFKIKAVQTAYLD